MDFLNKILTALEIVGRCMALFLSWVFILALFAAALFGGNISVKINNPFWDKTEQIQE